MVEFYHLVTPENDNQELVIDFLNMGWNCGEYHLLLEMMGPSFFYKNTLRGESFNQKQYIEFIRSFRKAMPDLVLEVDEIMSKGDRVMANSLFRGTLKRKFFNIAPSKKIIAFPVVSFFTIREDLVADISSVIDVLDVERQLGNPLNIG